MRRREFIAGLGSAATWPVVVRAQSNYPERNIRLIYGFSAGVDIQTRLLADKLTDVLRKPVIVENVTGAAGNIAADRAAKAPPDGYTIGMLGNTNIVINVSLYNRLSFDPVRDLVPVTQVYGFPHRRGQQRCTCK
jgi:tripartite-type tricarboxylate transporter receptor subunit TctC